jgi:hypothetical protein
MGSAAVHSTRKMLSLNSMVCLRIAILQLQEVVGFFSGLGNILLCMCLGAEKVPIQIPLMNAHQRVAQVLAFPAELEPIIQV